MTAHRVRPADAAVKAYHAALKQYAAHGAVHEGATETAFSRLLSDTARPHGWTLIPKKGMKVGGKQIFPDGTLQDGNFLPRGYWEAKDTADDLDAEIVAKRKKGYRLGNIIFEDTRRNVIAAEVEKVITALVSQSFSRDQFLKALDRFYKAIENAAETITEFEDKQHFLNTVYERFFQGYSVKTADTHGIVYTPQPIVDFMCASVEEVLRTEFGLTLGSKEVKVLDPCTGTGNFVVSR